MLKKLEGTVALFLILALLTSCSSIPVDSLIGREEPTSFPVLPDVTAASRPDRSPEAYTMQLEHASGKTVTIEDADAARLLLLAGVDLSQRTEDKGFVFAHKVTVYDGQHQALVTFDIADGGEPYGRDPDGQVFFLPQYCQSILEASLWPEYLSLWSESWQWNGDTDATGALEIRLPYYLNCFLAQTYGYADAYFSTYRLYEAKNGKHQVTLNMIAVRKACRIQENQFSTVFSDSIPLRLTLDQSVSGSWRLSSVRFADFSKGISKEAVRSVFSYELTKTIMDDLSDTRSMEESLNLQIRSYMLLHRLNDLVWEP